ncbi:hypothetical protein JW930_07315 [Candidatus Woesearchaeota archaeon]|nr:hypothetical protein [Candidatus Woesearchaeota archaeon]
MTHHKKHYIIKTHTSHKWLIGAIMVMLVVFGYFLSTKITSVVALDDNSYKVITTGLLFSITLILMVLVVLLATFYIEVKDKYLED